MTGAYRTLRSRRVETAAHGFQAVGQHRVVDRLLKSVRTIVVLRQRAHVVARQVHHPQLRLYEPQAARQFDAGDARQAYVGQQQLEGLRSEERFGLFGSADGRVHEASFVQQLSLNLTQVVVVFNVQDTHGEQR